MLSFDTFGRSTWSIGVDQRGTGARGVAVERADRRQLPGDRDRRQRRPARDPAAVLGRLQPSAVAVEVDLLGGQHVDVALVGPVEERADVAAVGGLRVLAVLRQEPPRRDPVTNGRSPFRERGRGARAAVENDLHGSRFIVLHTAGYVRIGLAT